MEHGIKFGFEYDGGATSQSCAKVMNGIIDNSQQTYLNSQQIKDGYCLLTVAYPRSDCELNMDETSIHGSNSSLKSGQFSGIGLLSGGGGAIESYVQTLSTTPQSAIGTTEFTLWNADWLIGLVGFNVLHPNTSQPGLHR